MTYCEFYLHIIRDTSLKSQALAGPSDQGGLMRQDFWSEGDRGNKNCSRHPYFIKQLQRLTKILKVWSCFLLRRESGSA
jgi:hypothetical protein